MATQPNVEFEHDTAEITPNIDHIVTEDDTPVDNIFSEKQQRLLTEPLYTAWAGPGDGRPFLAMANVGVFYGLYQPPLVPDMFLSLDVRAPEDMWKKQNRSYFLWEYGKPPDVVIEIVSNTKGGELEGKPDTYAMMGVLYYVVFDPAQRLKRGALQIYELHKRSYVERAEAWFPEIGLGLTIWHGEYEGVTGEWLRWCEQDGTLIPTGAERAGHERQRAEHEHQRAEHERQRAERLAAQLRALGIEPEEE